MNEVAYVDWLYAQRIGIRIVSVFPLYSYIVIEDIFIIIGGCSGILGSSGLEHGLNTSVES
jgi:hypothetical protein